MKDSQYHRATQIKKCLDAIERTLNYFHSDERHILLIATEEDILAECNEIPPFERVKLTRKYQMQLNQMLIDYKNELETEFEEL